VSLNAADGIEEISLDDAWTLYRQKKAVFLDARDSDTFWKGHVPGALNIPPPDAEYWADDTEELITLLKIYSHAEWKDEPMNALHIITIGLAILAVLSGMLGLGVAFSAVPFLGLFMPDLYNQVQPLSLLLNGITALFATFGFAKSGFVDWKKAIILSVITTVSAPVGAYLGHFTSESFIWYAYLASVTYLAYRLFKPTEERDGKENFTLALVLAIPISILAGLLGIGPGFLLMPTLIILGFETKKAAGINAFAVTPPSFSALIPHLPTAQFDVTLTTTLLLVGAVGSFLGARITSLYVPGARLKQLFGIVIVILTLYKIYTLLV